jgi:hypothetical protein
MTLPAADVHLTAVSSAHEGAAATVQIEVDIRTHSIELALLQVHKVIVSVH